MGTLIKGLGADHVCWASDRCGPARHNGQIEGLRRLEIPEAMAKEIRLRTARACDGR